MQTVISMILNVVTYHILRLTLYETIRSSHDFKDVKAALNDRADWSIELFRSCFTIHIIHGSYFFTLCTLSFLIMAESIHIHYGRLSPAELKERAESMGYATFATLFVALDIGFVVVRIAGLFALSRTPGLATSLVLIAILPSIILPSVTYTAKLVKQRARRSSEGDEMERGIA